MGIRHRLSPALDGAAVTIEDGTPRRRTVLVPDEYAVPLWLRPDGFDSRAIRIDSLPWRGVLRAGQLDLLSSAPVLPGTVWSDDFEVDRLASYFEHDTGGGSFTRQAGTGYGGSVGMACDFTNGQINGGNLKLAFGRTPGTYFDPVDAGTSNYRDIYVRFRVKVDADWVPNGNSKLARLIVFANDGWAEAAILHLWTDSGVGDTLILDPASGTDVNGNLQTTGYNDFANFRWLGSATSTIALFSGANRGVWHEIEVRMRLNDPGLSNGLAELWIDGVKDLSITALNWLGSYDDFAINAAFVENYINNGSAQAQTIVFDDLEVAPDRIGTGVAPDLFDVDFDGYTDTADLLGDTGTWNTVGDVNTGEIDLVAAPAGSGHSKAMRYHYNHGANGCSSITVARQLTFDVPQKEIWAEFVFRYSTNFSTEEASCYPNDHKFIFGDTEAPLNGRWDFRIGTFGGGAEGHAITISRPSPFQGETLYPNQGPVPFAEAWWESGLWQKVRFHIKCSTTATSDDGEFRVWITYPTDGLAQDPPKLRHELTGFSIDDGAGGDDRITGFSFCHNKDDGPPNTDMYIYWGHIKVWSAANPPSWAV